MKHNFKGSDYVSVWYGEVEAETIGQALEKLFRIHNSEDRPNGRGMLSMSVSNVVELDGVPYYCDRFGWSEVPRENWRN